MESALKGPDRSCPAKKKNDCAKLQHRFEKEQKNVQFFGTDAVFLPVSARKTSKL